MSLYKVELRGLISNSQMFCDLYKTRHCNITVDKGSFKYIQIYWIELSSKDIWLKIII